MTKIELDRTYFGFGKDKSAFIQGRIHNTLDKKFRFASDAKSLFNDRIMSRKVSMYSELKYPDASLEVKENYSYYGSNGEMTAPKNQYRLCFANENSYRIITKTEYEYGLYLIANNFLDEKIADAFITKESSDKIAEELAEKEAMDKAEEEREKDINERLLYSRWWRKEAQKIPDSGIIYDMNKIYLKNDIDCGISLSKKMILILKNLDKKLCQDDLLEWLHTYNPASKKAFTLLTGVKLPSSDRDTLVVLKEYIRTHSKGD